MQYTNALNLSEQQFRRLTGVKKATFQRMLEILEAAEMLKKARGGRPNKLNMPERLLMTLEYLREYRTYLHIGSSYGISESNAYQSIRWVENTLIKSKEFSLPGKKALDGDDIEIEVLLIDATETPIERPKKSRDAIIQERKSDTQ